MTQTPPPAPGWTRLLFKSKFGAGRDFTVLNTDDQQVMLVDGKIGATPKAEVLDGGGNVAYRVKGQFLGIPKRMEITKADGTQVAELKAKMFSPIKSKMTLHMADGHDWQVEGTIMEKNYTISSDGQPVARISQKWLAIRDQYAVEFLDSYDPGMIMAIIWAIDRWVERD